MLKLALAQLNPTVGDLAGNARLVAAARDRAGAVDLVVTPELMLCGYPPEDLVLRPAFVEACVETLETLAKTTKTGPALLVGTPWPDVKGGRPYNAAALLAGGKVQAVTAKRELPNYGVFDEQRVFRPGPWPLPLTCNGVRLGVLVCEDIWSAGPARAVVEGGAEILVVLNASPFERGKQAQRLQVAQARVRETGRPLVYVNMMGGQDELVFDGRSFVLDARAGVVATLPAWAEAVQAVEWDGDGFAVMGVG